MNIAEQEAALAAMRNETKPNGAASLQIALAHWSSGGMDELVDFRLRVAQTEALISIAQSLAVLAKEAEEHNHFIENHAAF